MLKNLKTILGKESDASSTANVSVNEATTATSDFLQQEEMVREFADDPTPDIEIIDSIENIYFSDMDFDASLHELEKLPEQLMEADLDKYRNDLRRQLQAVSRQLSQKILDNQRAYVQGLDRVMELESNLQKANKTCIGGRRSLAQAEKEIAVNPLQILAKNRRKLLLEKLLKSLRFIKTLQQTDLRLKELLQENKYARAIQLCLECQQAAVTFHQYHCISELSSNLQEILEQIEEQLDVALSKVCKSFSIEEYTKIQAAYALLGKTQIAMDQLQMHFVNTINTVAQTTLVDFIRRREDDVIDTSFNSLCKRINLEDFTPCLVQLCKSFWRIMYSYQDMIRWHEKQQNSESKDEPKANSIFDDCYVKSKLDQGLARICQDIQHKIKAYVVSTNFAYFKYDEFIKILDVISRLISVGQEFSNDKSQALQDSIQVQTENYFRAYHKSTMDELRMFLENEAWQLCPVKFSFSALQLQEFFFIKTDTMTTSESNENIIENKRGDYFQDGRFSYEKTPFDVVYDADANRNSEVIYDSYEEDDDDDDVPDELKQDFVDENTGEEAPTKFSRQSSKTRSRSMQLSENTLIVTNTTINVLRSFGKYMQMMNVLKPIAFDVMVCLSQLFDYYMYSVFTFFCQQGSKPEDRISKLGGRLMTCLSRIHSNIILTQGDGEESQKVPPPTLSPMVNLESSETLYGFTHKLIGVESLVFLSSQLRMLYRNLESLIPSNKRPFLSQFFTQTVDTAGELRSAVYKTVGERAIQYDKILQMMSSVKWDPKDIMSQHSGYVDSMVQEYQILNEKLTSYKNIVPIPVESSIAFWSSVIIKTNRLLVEGFSAVKKCSNEGRALMLLDFQQFLMKIDKITNVKPVPEREYVENYIKAFYLSEALLEQWLKDHQEYSAKQLNSLVTCGTGSHIGKKMRQKLLGILEEIQEAKTRTLP